LQPGCSAARDGAGKPASFVGRVRSGVPLSGHFTLWGTLAGLACMALAMLMLKSCVDRMAHVL
jgi:hypothetical protein